MRILQLLGLAVLSVLLIWKGIVPAFTTVGTDFANYYTSSHILLHNRENIHRLYDARWFGQRAVALGSPEGGIFQPFPPPTALLMIPLSMFPVQTAKSIWTVLNIGILTAVAFLISRSHGLDYSFSWLLLLGSGFALINNFYLGQVYLLMVMCLALSIRYFQQGRDVLSGVCAGLFVPIKYFPLCLIFFFLLQKRWVAAASAVLAVFAVVGISVAVMGLEIHRIFFDSVLFEHLDGQMANPFSATYQSWNSLLRGLFVRDHTFNANPLLDWAPGFDYVRALILIGLTAVLLRILLKNKDSKTNLSLYVAALFAFTLLVAPAAATYHFLLLSIPMAMVSSHLLRTRQFAPLSILLLLYVGMGAIPAGALDRLHLEGVWKLLAYPRLYLLSLFFLALTPMMKSSRMNGDLGRTLE